MAEIKTQTKTDCDTEQHTEHLCYMISQGFHISDAQEFHKLTENAQFSCNHCGRTAKSNINLCAPKPL